MIDVVNPLQSTSYTNKDFISIYNELLELAKELAATWDPTISNESDPGVVLLKLNALIGDKLSYNSDTNVLELFPLSVTQEKNARQLFEQLGYYMHWYKGAITNVAITWTGDTDDTTEYTIPEFVTVSDYNNNLIYTLIGPVDGTTINTYEVGSQKLKLDGSTTAFKAIQGIPVTYTVNGDSNITINYLDSNNRLYFPTVDVAENGIFITNIGANNYTDWKKVDNLLVQQISSTGLFYRFGVTQDTSTCYIEFPENAEELIKEGLNITYIKTLGEDGNTPARTLEKFQNEISPEENPSLVFTTDNIRMLNYMAAINGANPEGINDAYKGYKSTVGIFETLVTLRDYIGYILRSGLVSNCFVCDRTNDVQSTYNVITQMNNVDQLVPIVEKHTEDTDVNHIGEKELSAFDLKLYLLQLPTADLTSISAYNSTFNMMPEASQSNVKTYIDDVKCVSHDYASILPLTTESCHFCYFKNKYPVNCKITTQYQLTSAAAKEVVQNVREALFKALNAQEVEFGEEIPIELVYDVIKKADERIKNVMLDNIEYTTYAVYYSKELKTFIDVDISSEDAEPIFTVTNRKALFKVKEVDASKFASVVGVDNYSAQEFIYDSTIPSWTLNGNAVDLEECGIILDTTRGEPVGNDTIIAQISVNTQMQDEVFVKSVLAGTTQFLVEDETFDYKLDQIRDSVFDDILDEVTAVKTNADVYISSANPRYTLRDNESIQLFSPNLIDATIYSTYVAFEYRLNNNVLSSMDYQLSTGEYVILYWKETSPEDLYNYAIYGPGNVIKLKSFNLDANKSQGTNLVETYLGNDFGYINIGTETNPILYTDSKLNNRMLVDFSNDVRSRVGGTVKELSTTNTLTIRRLNQITLTPSNSYCYWVLNNKIEDEYGNETYRLFNSGEDTKLLNSGEYFIYSDENLTNLTILGSGTLLKRSDTFYDWEVEVKDISSILEYGVGAFTEDEWFKLSPSDVELVLTEQTYVSIPQGSTMALSLKRDSNNALVNTSYYKVSTTPNDIEVFNEKWFSELKEYNHVEANTFKLTCTETRMSEVTTEAPTPHLISIWKLEYQEKNADGTVSYKELVSNIDNLSDWGISLPQETDPQVGDEILVVVEEDSWSFKIDSDGVKRIRSFIVDGTEEIILEPTTFDGIAITYKRPTDSGFTNLDTLALQADDFNWSARTLLALNITNKKEQVLLKNQSITAYLNVYYYEGDAIQPENNKYFFTVGDEIYQFPNEGDEVPETVTEVIFDTRTEELIVNGQLSDYNIVSSSDGAEIEVSNEYTIEGGDLQDLDTQEYPQRMYYPSAIMSNFDVYLDGSQVLPTYNINDDGEFEYLSLYVFNKILSSDSQIHIGSDGDIDLDFRPNAKTIKLPFKIPAGEYILPVEIGSEELEKENPPSYLQFELNDNILHSIYSDTDTSFNKKQRYIIYMNIEDDENVNVLTCTIVGNISKNIPVVLKNLYKFTYKEGLSQYQIEKYLQLLRNWDVDNIYNYTYVVNEDEEISNPLEGKSFFLSNHIFNKFTIPQISSIDINILGKK